MKKILFISGSLRKNSLNSALARKAMAKLDGQAECLWLDYADLPAECLWLDYADLPMLDQDIEFPAPEAVTRVRDAVACADALWIASPEYNHSYSAALKNLIDWLSRPLVPGDYSTAVGRGHLVALSSAAGSSGGSYGLGKLADLLHMLSCRIVPTRTMVALGERFGAGQLVLTEEEEASLGDECRELIIALQQN